MPNRHERRKSKKKDRQDHKIVADEAVHNNSTLTQMDRNSLLKLREALTIQQDGDIEAALVIYRSVLKKYPNNVECLKFCGMAEHASNRPQKAVDLFNKAIEINPSPELYWQLANALTALNKYGEARDAFAQYLSQSEPTVDDYSIMGSLHHHLGEFDEALECLDKGLAQNPDHVSALNNLAAVYLDMGRIAEAERPLQRGLELAPTNVNCLCNYALYNSMVGQNEKAIELYKKALDIDPQNVIAEQQIADILPDEKLQEELDRQLKTLPDSSDRLKSLKTIANLMIKLGQNTEALEYLHQAMVLAPEDSRLFALFAYALLNLDRPDDAVPYIEAAIRIDPLNSDAYVTYSQINHALYDYEFAVACLAQAMTLRPGEHKIIMNLGIILFGMGNIERAEEAFQSILADNPESSCTRYNYSFLLLHQGRIKEGWENYHWRYRCQSFWSYSPIRHFPQPEWDGTALQGRKMLVYSEQGIGDQILFSTVLPDLLDMGGELTFEIDHRLVPLYQRTYPEINVLPAFTTPEHSDDTGFDYTIAAPDLCRFFRNDFSEFPTQPRTLVVDAQKADKWKNRLAEISDRPKIGISWRGGFLNRSRTPAYAMVDELSQILSIEGVDFINTQYSFEREELDEIKERYGVDLHSWDDIDMKNDQDEFAALLSELDLVITPSTATSSLAGVVGQKTFIFVLGNRNWDRLGQDYMPWYKDVSIFTKPESASEWTETFDEMSAEIRKLFSL